MTLGDLTPLWKARLNSNRRKHEGSPVSPDIDETRTELERDHDRILFSTPVRRLADKTQVFPLEKNDSVRTRLTHSHEVANLARSFGTALAFKHKTAHGVVDAERNIPALLAAIGLVHDLGNPPFGHQGEVSIQSWFSDNESVVLAGRGLSAQQILDFKKFDGNAQSFRLVSRLQLLNDDFGLDLTYASLAGMMKYSVASDRTAKSTCSSKKHGFFASEEEIAKQVFEKVGLEFGQRHPMAYVMEACDDIAYAVLDVEDAVKKGLASFTDLIDYLKSNSKNDPLVDKVVSSSEAKHDEYRRQELSHTELNDASMQRFRVFAIATLIQNAQTAFIENEDQLVHGTLKEDLCEISQGKILRELLKKFGRRFAYQHRSVLELELAGHNVIRGLMDIFWDAIINRQVPEIVKSERRHPYSRYVYGRISENYRRVFERPSVTVAAMPIRYRECLLLTDMISGMTDSFAMGLYDELQGRRGNYILVREPAAA